MKLRSTRVPSMASTKIRSPLFATERGAATAITRYHKTNARI